MADKLSESIWSAFLKKQKLDLDAFKVDDKALVKALAAFDKADESKPEPRLKALEEVIKQIPEQVKALVKRKKELGDKPFGLVKDQLYELLEQAEQLHKKTQAALAEAEKKDKGKDEEEDDEPGNVLLEPKRLLAMLQRCKRDPELSMHFGFVDAQDKKPAAFALHPRMSGRKLFEALKAETGVKTGAFGTAWVQVDGEFKGTCLMLQLDKPLSGLVKKVKAPVKAVGFKIAKAVLWSADGKVFEQEDETDETAAPGAGGAGTGAPARPQSTEEPRKPASAEQLAYTQRLLKVRDRYAQALKDQHVESTKLRAVMDLAREKADEKKDYAAAIQALQMVERLLGSTQAGGVAGMAGGGAEPSSGDGVTRPAPPVKPASAAALAYTQRLRKVSARLEEALRAQHPEATKLRALSGFASEKAAADDYLAAVQALTALEKVLGAPGAGAETKGPDETRAETQPSDGKALRARLQAVREDAVRMGVVAQIAQPLGQAAEAVRGGDATAAALLDALEQRLAGLAGTQRAADAAATIAASKTAGGVGVVEFAKMRLELEAARPKFDEAIDNLKTSFEALLESDDFVDDPRSADPATRAKIDTLEQRLPSFPELGDRVDDAIDKMASAADPELRQQHSEAALKAIAEFRARIDAEPMLTEMESTDAGSFPIHATMVATLDRLATALRA
jgi:hypothetical protein